MLDDLEHEALVEAFMLRAQLDDPERFAVIRDRYPVKSKRQLQRIAKTEVSVGLYPGKLAGDVSVTQPLALIVKSA